MSHERRDVNPRPRESTNSAKGFEMHTDPFLKSPLRPRVVRRESAAERFIDPAGGFVAIVGPDDDERSLAHFVARHAQRLEQLLGDAGGLLFRGFRGEGAAAFRDAALAFGRPLLPYLERAATRSEVIDGVLTSTEFSPNAWIDMHHELSFSRRIPERIFFFAEKVADEGGETPVADERQATALVDRALVSELRERALCYRRNFRPEIDMDWRSAFQTQTREGVERYCRAEGIEWTWHGPDHLETSQRVSAVLQELGTGRTLLCNHAHIFHPSMLQTEIRESLLAEYGEAGLPRNVTFGDGSAIPDSAVAHLARVYEQSRFFFSWRAGDVLLLDNRRCLHGRAPFRGTRTTLVCMTGMADRNA
jgi:alpha-ketoglutarate-dependent taurine dioxygenase